MRAYRLVQWLLRTATRVFFRRVEVVGSGNIPAAGEGGVIFCGNHPNSLLDPVLITAYCGRIVHFAAKDVLFRSRVLRFFLNLMGAVPIFRRRDHGGAAVDNAASFAALHRVLGEGRAIGIFPEGISHDASHLAPLKTGAARIALGARAEHPGTPIYLVPTGLSYFRRHRFRSSVLVQFGAPIEVTAAASTSLRAGDAGDDPERVRAITDELDRHLRALTINAASWETLWVLDAVRRLYQPEGITLGERVELARRFNTVYPTIKDRPEVRQLYDRVRTYQIRLSAAGLTDDLLRRDFSVRETAWRILGHLVLLGGALPLAVIGAPIHLPLLYLFRLAGRYLAPRKDVVATTKFVVGLLGALAVYAGLIVAAAVLLDVFWAILVAILFPLTGRAVLHVISRVDALRHIFLTSFRVLRLRREVGELRAERRALSAEVAAAVERFRPAEMEPMFADRGDV
jgi:1-acyl-sn-glycerol-3-phosphate acyltransferase